MNAAELQKQRAALEAERERLNKRVERRRLEQSKDYRREQQIGRLLRRLKILEYLNVPQGIVTECTYPEGHRLAKLNDAAGTLISMKRLYAIVDFGELGKWKFLPSDLLPATQRHERGRFMGYLSR